MITRSPKEVGMTMSIVALFTQVACAPQRFEGILPSVETETSVSAYEFKLASSSTSMTQESLDQNVTSVSFQVMRGDGSYVQNLVASDLKIKENEKNLTTYELSSNSQQIVQTVDIVFAVDVTGSMSPTIESAKARLIDFVSRTRANGYHTRMCLVTFGDYTVKKCDRFYDNDPSDPATLSQVAELVSEITKLRALTGANDPGGYDYNENPMRALIDASKSPWASDSQRFVILITDDGFLYSPGNSGAVGALAPQYAEVLTAIQESQIRVFASTPSKAGYDKPFKGQPGIVEASQGEFFLFSNLISGKITFDTILNRIISYVKTTYVVQYVADQNPGLDASLPLAQRFVKIGDVSLKDGGTGSVVNMSVQSNLPNGRAQYQRKWKLSSKKIYSGSLQVKVNDQVMTSGFSLTNDGELEFDAPPAAGSKIDVIYQLQGLEDALQMSPIQLDANEDLLTLEVHLNGLKATTEDLLLVKDLEGRWSLLPGRKVLDESDPFGIRQAGGLLIEVKRQKIIEK